MSETTIEERLEAAERMCWLYGMTALRRLDSPREKAVHEAWRAWLDLVTEEDRKAARAKLTNSAIAAAARRYDQHKSEMQSAMLARIKVSP